MTVDVIVVGLGVIGGSAAYQLAARGAQVLGLDRYSPPHALGSSHGHTRIIREAYFEHPGYVPLIQRAFTTWELIERASGTRLLTTTGGLMIGPRNGMVAGGAKRSATIHALAHEELAADEVHRRFPALRLSGDMIAIHEPKAGVLQAERTVSTLLALARAQGARLHFDEPVLSWSSTAAGVEVRTARQTYSAARLILAAGPWIASLWNDVPVRLQVERTRVFWFRELSDPAVFQPDRLPIFAIEFLPDRMLYGFPNFGDGVKVALHYQGEPARPDDPPPQAATPGRLRQIRALLQRHLPLANGELIDAQTCMYTNTSDLHFIIDVHPSQPHVIVASPCSGHGFKFASVIGEILADLALEGRTPFDISMFSLRRFSDQEAAGPSGFQN
jgi:sarcosine oxidase